MFERLYSLVLVAAVIACPMRCIDCQCHAAECHSAQCDSVPLEKVSSADAPCCPHCTVASADNKSGQSKDDRHAPSPDPCQSTCQGICGGAVFQKPCTLNLPTVVKMMPLNEDQFSRAIAQPLPFRGSESGRHCGTHSGKNIGRLLRIEQMSFVC